MTATYVTLGVMCLVLIPIADPLVGLFNLEPQSAEMAAEVLRWWSIFTMLFWPLAFTLPNSLRAAGDVVFTMTVSLLSMFIFRIGFSYLLGADWGLGMHLLGVWIAMFIDWIARDIAFVIRFWRGKWKQIKVI